MIKHTFLDKCCTIFKDSDLNTGLNPVAELNYGKDISRALIHFDINELKELYENKTYPDINQLKHVLKLTNCGSVNNDIHDTPLTTRYCDMKERATSFDMLLFKVPKEWDGGKGVDYITDFWITENHKVSNLGCNWFQRINGGVWDNEGIYTSNFLSKEYDKFSEGEDSVIIARQHFDIGNENFEFDITDYVNKLIIGVEENCGLGLCFTPSVESKKMKKQQYVGFFTCHTNTFFHPYLETTYGEKLEDNRDSFELGKTNRLFLYCSDGTEFFNLDELPTCTIEGFDKDIKVKQYSKGIYYAEFSLKNNEMEPYTILYDKWANLAYNGEKLEDEEFEFVVLPRRKMFNVDEGDNIEYVPNITGIYDNEKVTVGEIRTMIVNFREKYTTNKYKVLPNVYYRVYVSDGGRELDVFPWTPIDKRFLQNRFTINTNDLIPNNYHIDIKVGHTIYKSVSEFQVVSRITNRYM